MQGPQVEYVPDFVRGQALFAETLAVVGFARNVAVVVAEPWPSWIQDLRTQLEQRCGHPMTECVAEVHTTAASDLPRWLIEAQRLAPNSFLAIVSAGHSRTIHFSSHSDYRVTSQCELEHQSVLLINERHLRRWRPMLPAWQGGMNGRVYFRYALTTPA